MALLNTWASQQDQATLSPLSRLLNNYIQKGDAPLAYLMRGDAQGLLKDLNTPKPVNTTQDMTNLALNLNPVMGLIGATAYHGSPAIFDKFDIKKLGSGEGAQVYGHGMYFAENPTVAKEYQNRLADFGSPYTFQYKDKIYEPSYLDNVRDPVRHAISLTYHQGKPQAQKIAKIGLEDTAKGEPYALEMGGKEYYQKMLDTAKSLSKKDIKAQQGAFYKVDIPDEYMPKMLDWDKPLNQQSNILPALRTPQVQNKLAEADVGFQELNMPASELYRKLSVKFGQKEASNILSQVGVPGIKYLDQGSRKAGGTQNFVVFDPSTVKILERNGILVNK
jgi:hypothetical protein